MVAIGFLQAICKTSAKSNGFTDGKNLGFLSFTFSNELLIA